MSTSIALYPWSRSFAAVVKGEESPKKIEVNTPSQSELPIFDETGWTIVNRKKPQLKLTFSSLSSPSKHQAAKITSTIPESSFAIPTIVAQTLPKKETPPPSPFTSQALVSNTNNVPEAPLPIAIEELTLNPSPAPDQIEEQVSKQFFTSVLRGPSGEVYEGECDAKNNPHGQGTMKYPEGKAYTGSWERGRANGHGKLTENGFTCEGLFQDDVFHGKGVMKCPDGSKYEGEFKAGNPHGFCKLTWPIQSTKDSDIYVERTFEGEWINGQLFNGRRDCIKHNKRDQTQNVIIFYEGDFKCDPDKKENNELYDGYGYLKNNLLGMIHEGKWKDCLANGFGIRSFETAGIAYEGEWKNNIFHGLGKEIDLKTGKVIYQGKWLKGEKQYQYALTNKDRHILATQRETYNKEIEAEMQRRDQLVAASK